MFISGLATYCRSAGYHMAVVAGIVSSSSCGAFGCLFPPLTTGYPCRTGAGGRGRRGVAVYLRCRATGRDPRSFFMTAVVRIASWSSVAITFRTFCRLPRWSVPVGFAPIDRRSELPDVVRRDPWPWGAGHRRYAVNSHRRDNRGWPASPCWADANRTGLCRRWSRFGDTPYAAFVFHRATP